MSSARTQTQASFSAEDAALTVFYGIVAFGQIQLRKIDGYYQLPALLEKEREKSRKDATWSTVSSPLRDQTTSTRPGTDPSKRCSHFDRFRHIRKLAPGALEPHRREPDDRR